MLCGDTVLTDFLRNFSLQIYLLSEFLPEIDREEDAVTIFFHI